MTIPVATPLLLLGMGIFSRKPKYKLPAISNEPGWEGSDEAYLLASNVVFGVANELEIAWFQRALKKYLEFLKVEKIKVNDEDFIFVQSQTGKNWDLFRNYMMSPEVNGAWNSDVLQGLFKVLSDSASHVPHKYQPPELEQFDKAQLTCLSLQQCLIEDAQILSNAVFEVVEVIWCHHLDGHPRRFGNSK